MNPRSDERGIVVRGKEKNVCYNTIMVKAICTIGPASEGPDILSSLILSGMDIARINFSHATEKQFIRIQKHIQLINKTHSKRVKILADLQGPRMRVGTLPKKGLLLKEGKTLWFSTDPSDTKAIHIDDPYLHEDVEIGHPMHLSNGEIELEILEKEGSRFKAVVTVGGILYSRKGVNLPDTNLTTTGLTPKDKKDIAFVVKHDVDMIAMSFVKDDADMQALRSLVNNPRIQLVAKIERKHALQNLDEIIDTSDILMVARGDLGIEIPIEDLPLVQKDIIKRATQRGKPSIVATQMLMSMINHTHPTRAEVSDIANAVLDGAWGLMLSDETAFGKYPLRTLEYLTKTADKAEGYLKK